MPLAQFKTHYIFRPLIFIFICSLAACASVTGNKTQPIAVTTVCEGHVLPDALCTLRNDKGSWQLKTTGIADVQKSYGDLAVTCEKNGAKGASVVVSKPNNGVWGNLILGGGIGYVVDSNSGAGFDYPSDITVVLAVPCQATRIESTSNIHTNITEEKK